MNGRVAKALRKKAYGDLSLKGERKYEFFETIKRYFTGETDKKGKREVKEVNKTTIICKGPRREYLDLKREHKARSSAA